MHTLLDLENDPKGARTLGSMLGDEYEIIHQRECGCALLTARRGDIEAVILDLELEHGDPLDFLTSVNRICGAPPVIVMSAKSDPKSVVQAVRCGAVAFLPKPVSGHDLTVAVARAIGRLSEDSTPFVGTSPAMRTIMQQIRAFAGTCFPLLITGESGTGKDLAARTLHELSARKKAAFIARNCAAIPENLVASELFGSAKGAYTGAVDRPGAFELAEGGTLFLDEIGESSPEVQATLLRALESGEFWRLGARASTKSEVRFISATSRDLDKAVEMGSFRRDLLYRIETLRLHLPPLRERPEDIAPLAKFLVCEAAPGRKAVSEDALALLMTGRWPGNVRQLRNVMQRAIVLSGMREEIAERDIVIY